MQARVFGMDLCRSVARPYCIEMGARIQQVFLDFATLDEVKFPEVSRLTP